MGKGGGGETARSVAEEAIQAVGVGRHVEVAQEINNIRANLGAPASSSSSSSRCPQYSGKRSLLRRQWWRRATIHVGGPAPHALFAGPEWVEA